MLKPVLKTAILGLLTLSLVACSSSNAPNRDTSSLSSLRSLSRVGTKGSGLTGLRYIAIRDTALSLGARGGLAYRATQMNSELKQHGRYLERLFNFNALLLDDNVLPPILIEGRQTLDQSNPLSSDAIRLSDRQYVILSQARFVTASPHWREYLWMDYEKPELPDPSLLPKDENEQKVWDKYVSEGWLSGVQQANAIFQENLGRLKRDYQGMVRYRTLLAQGIVSAPFVARNDMGVTGNSEELAINDRILRITALPSFQTNSANWSPITSEVKEKIEDPAESNWALSPESPLPLKPNDPKQKNWFFSFFKPKLALNIKKDCPDEQS